MQQRQLGAGLDAQDADRGWRAARRAGTPAARGRSRGRGRRAGAGRPTAARAGGRAGRSIPSDAAARSHALVDRAPARHVRASAGRRRGSRARSCADRARSSGTPSPDRAAAAARPVTSSPSIRMRPLVGASRPAISRSTVLLPLPDGPTSTSSSPSAIVEVEVAHGRDAAGKTLLTRWSEIAAISAL